MRQFVSRLSIAASMSIFLVGLLAPSAFAESVKPIEPPVSSKENASVEKEAPKLFDSEITEERQNEYPIVLVHGFAGWGRNEVAGFKYWGGLIDLQKDLTSHGYETYTAAVGPLSSNWDRACELYAQLKGGTVDYGAAHSAKHGHERFGRTFDKGLDPDWGEINPQTGKPNKIHLLAHSQGGQTARLLVQLLATGDSVERESTLSGELSPLFDATSKDWVDSVTTLSTPHDGTSLTDMVDGLIPHAQQILGLISAATGGSDLNLFDFKLDQWGLKKRSGESFDDYFERVKQSRIWTETKDTAQWDLSPDGAKKLNTWVHAQPNVYYFSVGTEQTYTGLITGHELPEVWMNPLFALQSTFMGAYTRNEKGKVSIDSSWWQNDGVVNTVSMDGPKNGSDDQIVDFTGSAKAGKWNYLGLMDSFDHADIIGIGTTRDMREWYRDLAGLLASLPE